MILSAHRTDNPAYTGRLVAIYTVLVVINGGAWLWACALFHAQPAMLGIALMIYGLGLRHAVDADHIAAIDNVTRKLMQENQRPVAVGFFFALGHSVMVTLMTLAVVKAAPTLGELPSLQAISTSLSSLFLIAIAAMNVVVFASVWRSYRRFRASGVYDAAALDTLLGGRGLLARLFRPLFATVNRSWHMFPLGVLFGLGFDTATEVAMFGTTGAQAMEGMPVSTVLVFPALFAAGMSLIDTTDGVLMLGAYGWAFVRPLRKLYYNMTVTLVSIVAAALIGGVEALGLVRDRLGLDGTIWTAVAELDDSLENAGFLIIGLFATAWVFSYAVHPARLWRGTVARWAR